MPRLTDALVMNDSLEHAQSQRCARKRSELVCVIVALGLCCLGAGVGIGYAIGNGQQSAGASNGSFAPPATMPERMVWRLTLVEQHDTVFPGAYDSAFGNYYFDWSRPPYVWSRQENSVTYVQWREDETGPPWNTFWAANGTVAAGYVDMATGAMVCKSLPFPYSAAFWPRGFMQSNCTLVQPAKVRPMPPRFGGQFYDGRDGVAYDCELSGGSMQIFPTIWTDPATGRLLRFDVQKKSPGWNPQTWDILEQSAFPAINDSFLEIPGWCK